MYIPTIPLDVPDEMHKEFIANLQIITQGSGRLMLMAGDQKVEHLNNDFFGPNITDEDCDPEHIFTIAHRSRIGALAAQLGLINHYGPDYRDIPYIIKINSKTNLIPTNIQDPISRQWQTIEQIISIKKTNKIRIVGIGYTIYPGSKYENQMLTEASRLIHEAHRYGLVTVIWAYPRGQQITDERDPHLLAGATGIAACLGADFVKISAPEGSTNLLQEAVRAAGRTRVVCAGGSATDPQTFLKTLYDQIHIAGTSGNATGRNIHQRPIKEAVRFANAIAAITFDNASLQQAMNIQSGKL